MERKHWDKRLGLGREKIFEVRKHYNDVTFIDEFLTLEFVPRAEALHLRLQRASTSAGRSLEREFKKVKEKLLHMLTNFGQPVIAVEDGNFDNRGELLVVHKHDGVDLKLDYARDTLKHLQSLWRRPVNLVSRIEGRGTLFRYDGKEHSDRRVEL